MGLSSVLAASAIARPGVCTSSTRPASPYEGQVIYETDTDKIMVWDGSAWVILSAPKPPTVSLYNTTDQALTGAQYNTLSFNSERWDTNGMHSTSSNTSRITIPSGWAGYYLFTANIVTTTSQSSITFLRNGTDRFYLDAATSGPSQANATAIIDCAVSDYVEVSCYPTANLTVYGTNSLGGTTSPLFQAIWLREL